MRPPWLHQIYLLIGWSLIVLLTLTQRTRALALTVSGVNVHKVSLYNDNRSSPWCFAVSSAVDLDPSINFLATQVWPSARVAATAVQQHLDRTTKWRVCEFGCGPALPSLTAAKSGAASVIATDLDGFALELVQAAAQKQHLDAILRTQPFDLTSLDNNNPLPESDLYILSDVFESSAVARGTAWHTIRALQMGGRVWVFAQSDRAQREVYTEELRQRYDPDLSWSSLDKYPGNSARLWLCGVDETTVAYG